jgi:hypothetical protein
LTGAVVATVVAAVIVMGSPSTLRARRLDLVRSENLMQLNDAIDHHWDHRVQLPAALDSLVSDHDLDSVPRDPVTTVAYQYTVTARDAFRLCATFAQPAADDQHEYVEPYSNPRLRHHGVGLTCFDLKPHDLRATRAVGSR